VSSRHSSLSRRSENVGQVQLPRHVIPDPGDNELYLLKIPPFFAVEPRAYDPLTFQPPTTEHHTKLPPSDAFNPLDTALSTIRWRRSPNDPEEIQSNARILRWSDGSLTMQLASDPKTQFEITAKPLAPPQKAPPKPTPVHSSSPPPSKPILRDRGYNPTQDSFTYLAEPVESAFVVRTTRKLTASLVVRQPSGIADTLESLQAEAAAIAARFKASEHRATTKIEDIRENPEEAKKEALRQEREGERRRRKEEREREKTRLGRAGGAARLGGGLTLDGLEGEGSTRRGTTRRGPGGASTKAKQPRRARRDSESDEEEELYGRRGGPQDQYEEDDFVVGSEDGSGAGGSDEDAEGEEDIDAVLELQERQAREKKRRGNVAAGDSPKRAARARRCMRAQRAVSGVALCCLTMRMMSRT
jgi:RNA polymerase-associated protein LEO1